MGKTQLMVIDRKRRKCRCHREAVQVCVGSNELHEQSHI